jgi:hypothetical protein
MVSLQLNSTPSHFNLLDQCASVNFLTLPSTLPTSFSSTPILPLILPPLPTTPQRHLPPQIPTILQNLHQQLEILDQIAAFPGASPAALDQLYQVSVLTLELFDEAFHTVDVFLVVCGDYHREGRRRGVWDGGVWMRRRRWRERGGAAGEGYGGCCEGGYEAG